LMAEIIPPSQEMTHHRLAADIMTSFVDQEPLPPRSQGAQATLYFFAVGVVFLLPSRGGGGKGQGDGPMGCGHASSKDEAFMGRKMPIHHSFPVTAIPGGRAELKAPCGAPPSFRPYTLDLFGNGRQSHAAGAETKPSGSCPTRGHGSFTRHVTMGTASRS
jgi:hypothetical protein